MKTSQARLGARSVSIIVLTLATAAIHFSRAVADPEIRVLFVLNGLGYVALLASLVLPIAAVERYRRLTRRVLMGYAALTIVLFIVWGVISGEWLSIGLIDKVVEIVLIFLLWQEDQEITPH